MPRQYRIDYPGALHHVIGRGIERSRIFEASEDKDDFIRRLRLLLSEYSMHCYAWCIMDNHFHLLLITGQYKLSYFMRSLLTGYAVNYNRRHKRSGHLFQNRYKSIICEADEYLLPLIRYVHLNPVRVRGVKKVIGVINRYKWGGHKEILDRSQGGVIDREEVLGYFGEREGEARREYMEYIKDGLSKKEDYSGGGLIRSGGGLRNVVSRGKADRESYDERILGCGGFVEEVLEKAEEGDIVKGKIKDISVLLSKIGGYYKVDETEILETRTKGVREARNVLVYIGNKYLNKSVTEMGKILGISEAAASISKDKGRQICKEKNILQKIIE